MSGVLVALSVGGGQSLITVTPETAEGFGSTPDIFTNTTTASSPVSGGTWLWTYVSGFSFNILTPTNAGTRFLAQGLAPGEDRSGLVQVTYSIGGTPVASRNVFVSVVRF